MPLFYSFRSVILRSLQAWPDFQKFEGTERLRKSRVMGISWKMCDWHRSLLPSSSTPKKTLEETRALKGHANGDQVEGGLQFSLGRGVSSLLLLLTTQPQKSHCKPEGHFEISSHKRSPDGWLGPNAKVSKNCWSVDGLRTRVWTHHFLLLQSSRPVGYSPRPIGVSGDAWRAVLWGSSLPSA